MGNMVVAPLFFFAYRSTLRVEETKGGNCHEKDSHIIDTVSYLGTIFRMYSFEGRGCVRTCAYAKRCFGTATGKDDM